MSHFDELIQKHCPNGVEFKALGEVGVFVRGNGMPKSDFTETGVGAIHYGQIYTYYGTWATETKSFVSPSTAAKLAKVDPGDIIITNTSENLEDVGKAVAWLGTDQIVTGGHATVFKHNEDPKYIAYWLQSPSFQVQKVKLATGTKVIDVSAKSLAKVLIPVPPREVQQEIVKILDTFSKLEAELEAELEARRKQYTFYRNQLLTFTERERRIRWARMTEVSTFIRGTAITAKQALPGDVPVVANGPIPTYSHSVANRTGETVVVARSGAYAGLVSYWNQPIFLTDAFSVHPDESVLKPRFVYYLLQNSQERMHAFKKGAGVPHVRVKEIESYVIPIPSLAEQDQIVSILDKFDALVNDLSTGLPAELKARRQQYEYYRDRLLTFQEAT